MKRIYNHPSIVVKEMRNTNMICLSLEQKGDYNEDVTTLSKDRGVLSTFSSDNGSEEEDW